jgi:hypothetical protein
MTTFVFYNGNTSYNNIIKNFTLRGVQRNLFSSRFLTSGARMALHLKFAKIQYSSFFRQVFIMLATARKKSTSSDQARSGLSISRGGGHCCDRDSVKNIRFNLYFLKL